MRAFLLACLLAWPAHAAPTGDAVVDECTRLFGRCKDGKPVVTERPKKPKKSKKSKKSKKRRKAKAERKAPPLVEVNEPTPVVAPPSGEPVEPPVEPDPEPVRRLPEEREGVPGEPGAPVDEPVEGEVPVPTDG